MNLLKHSPLLILFAVIGCKDATKEVFTNYQKSESRIFEAENYFKQIMPNDLVFYIKFLSRDRINFKLDQKDYWDKNSWNKNRIFDAYGQFHKFDTDLRDEGIIEALKILKIDRQAVDKLKTYLLDANCNSISNHFSFSESVKISNISLGYPTDDLYGLYYVLFEKNLDTLQGTKIIKSCSYKKINNRVFVEYGGPAFGSDCFPDKK